MMKSPSEITCPSCGEPISSDYLTTDPARRRYFSIVKESFENLPESLVDRFPSHEHLRKWCLVKAGWCDVSLTACESEASARQLAVMARRLDTFAVVSIQGKGVTICLAKSQSRKAQPKAQFMETAQKVYRILSELLGADVEQAA